MKRVRDSQRYREHRGYGEGANYKPWLKAREIPSLGTRSNPINWKTGRITELASQGEDYLWHCLMWQDDVIDIREQFPLFPLALTEQIAEDNGIRHPRSIYGNIVMTTDFLVLKTDGYYAIDVKNSESDLDDQRVSEKLWIAQRYWKLKDIPYEIRFKSNMNQTLANNIRFVCQYYDRNRVFDQTSYIKYLIARKKISVDMSTEPLNIGKLLIMYKEEAAEWKTTF